MNPVDVGTPARTPIPAWLDRDWPVITAVLAAIATFTFALVLYPTIPLASDAFGYTSSAWRLITQGFFSYSGLEPDAYVTPAYPAFLASIYWFTRHSASLVEAARVAHPFVAATQLLFALATVAVIARCGVVLGGALYGLAAGMLAAGYLPFAWASSMALSENLGVLLISLQLLVTLDLVGNQRPSSGWKCALYGIITGLLALTRPAYVLWAILPVGWIALHRRASFSAMARWTAPALLGFVLVMAPWWTRNAIVLGQFIPLSSSGGEAKLAAAGGYPLTTQEQVLRERETAAGRDGVGAVASARLAAEWDANPQRFVVSRLRTAVVAVVIPYVAPDTYFSLEQGRAIHDDYRIDFGPRVLEAPEPLRKATALTVHFHRGLILLAMLGILFVKRWPRLLLVASLPVYSVLLHSVILFFPRYFFPTLPAVIVLAAGGLCGAVLLVMERKGSYPTA